MTAEERWVNVEEVATHLGVTKDTIYRWIDKQDFPAHRAGRLLRFKLSEIDDWVRLGGSGGAKSRGQAEQAEDGTRKPVE